MTDNNTATELLTCPFCGGDAETDNHQPYRNYVTGEPNTGVAAYCTKCSANMIICRGDVPDVELEEIVEQWNTRIRAETAKNSGEVVNGAPERICVAQDSDGFWTCREAVLGSQEYVRADIERDWRYEALRLKALLATPANSRADYDHGFGEGYENGYKTALRETANSRAEAIGAREAAIRECIAAVELYAASYSTMSKIGNGKVSASDVAYDMRENIIGRNLRALLQQEDLK